MKLKASNTSAVGGTRNGLPDPAALRGSETGAGAVAAERRRREGQKQFLDALIMMVDDEPSSIEVTQVLLEDAGYTRFVSTSDPATAMALLAAHRPDVLLLDLLMPEMSGFEILARMEAGNILKNVPTIILTSSLDSATKLKAAALGATEFFTKPVDPSELVLRLRNTLAAKAYWQGCWAPTGNAGGTSGRGA